MNNAELIKDLRQCADEEETCDGCGHFGFKGGCIIGMLCDAADALEAADEKITKLENPKAYITVDFNGDYVLCQANYVYNDGARLSSEIAKVRFPLEDGEHGMSLGNNIVIATERKEDGIKQI